jgi:predicted Zn finger-like uncharacterized protein
MKNIYERLAFSCPSCGSEVAIYADKLRPFEAVVVCLRCRIAILAKKSSIELNPGTAKRKPTLDPLACYRLD